MKTQMKDLQRYDRDGIELIINNKTGEAFATQSGYSRMSGKDRTTIVKRCQKLSESDVIFSAEIDTGYGIKLCELIPAKLVFEWSLKDNPELALKMGEVGATVFLHQLAGYKISSTATVDKQTSLEETAKQKILELIANDPSDPQKVTQHLKNIETLNRLIKGSPTPQTVTEKPTRQREDKWFNLFSDPVALKEWVQDLKSNGATRKQITNKVAGKIKKRLSDQGLSVSELVKSVY